MSPPSPAEASMHKVTQEGGFLILFYFLSNDPVITDIK